MHFLSPPCVPHVAPWGIGCNMSVINKPRQWWNLWVSNVIGLYINKCVYVDRLCEQCLCIKHNWGSRTVRGCISRCVLKLCIYTR
jgi:hypothetical protein